jgi:hypothetical protein
MALLVIGTGIANAQITVDATAGTASASYTTLNLALSAINSGVHQGNITVTVHQGTTETNACFIDSVGSSGGASYTSILIKPADTSTVTKEITTSVAANVLLELKGADNVIVDGRKMGTGSGRFLRFRHTATTATTAITLRLINGASNCVFRYTEFYNATRGLAGGVNVNLSTSAATTGNANDTIDHCYIEGGRSAFSASGTATSPMTNIILKSNILFEYANVGIGFSSVKTFTVDSNILSFGTAGPTNPFGMAITLNIDGSVATIIRNRISDLSTTLATTITGISITSTAATPVVTPVINVYNNYVSLMQSSASATTITGMTFAGATPAVCRMIHNTVRIGGTHTGGTAGGVVSYGCLLNNTVVGTTSVFRNNIMINNRNGGTAGVFHTGFRISSASVTTNTLDIDFNIYWATGGAGNGPYPATWVNTLYGQPSQATYRAAAAPSEKNSIFGNVNFVSNTDLSLAGTSINDFANLGCMASSLVTDDIFSVNRDKPTYKGAHQATFFTNRKDASVKEVYTLGKLPIPYATPHEVRAAIVNAGADTLFNQQINLQISGTNTFTDLKSIDTIAPWSFKYVSFSSFNYTNTGNCIVTVSVPNDSTNSNNSKPSNQTVTNDVYAYADPTIVSAGGIGFNSPYFGQFVAKFPYSGFNSINQVGINFNTGGQPYKIVIYDLVNDTPGTLLWTSASLTSVAGINTVPVFPTVSVAGTFFVGVSQTATTNVSFGYQSEDPVRDKTFYYKSTNSTTSASINWSDFAAAGSPYRFMVEPRLQVANDIGVESVQSPCLSVMQGSASMNPKIKVLNYGLNTRTSVVVAYQITGPATLSGSDSLSLGSLFTGQSATLTLSNLFNPTVAGTYTMKVWTRIPGLVDGARDNDTATYTFTVVNLSTYTNAGNQITLDGSTQSLSVNGDGALNISGNKLTLESWVYYNSTAGLRHIFAKNLSDIIPQYNLYVNASGAVVFKINTSNGVDSVVTTSTLSLLSYSHIAAVYDASITEARIYINGALAGSKAISGPITANSGTVYIGRGYAGGTTYFAGNLDEVRIWDTARTESQIRRGMHTRMANAPHVNLKGYWRMDSLVNNVIADASGNCNAATVEGTPTMSVSPLPLGAPVISTATVTTSGVTNLSTASLSLNTYGQAGTNDLVIHRFAGLPNGTLPSTTPGGVTSTNINNWIMYRYGAGLMDSVDVTFSITGISTGAVASDIKLFSRSNGSNAGWTQLTTATAVNPTTQTVTLRMFTPNFGSQITIGANNNPLPVKLLYIDATTNAVDVDLTWATASEMDNAGFHIERSTDGKEFKEVGFVKGNGNSAEQTNYRLRDEKAFAETGVQTLYYRLLQMDFDGTTDISNMVTVSADKAGDPSVIVYPNPFISEATIHVNAAASSDVQIRVLDITGKQVLATGQVLQKGTNTITTEGLSDLSKGVYMVQVMINGEITTHKLLKQ